MKPVAISIVVPTCNRKTRLLSLLRNLDEQLQPVAEVIIVDASDEPLQAADYAGFSRFPVRYLVSEKSVCIQRNRGIRQAVSPWILLCDDDIELPPDYLQVLSAYIGEHPATGAVSGRWMEKEKEGWTDQHPEHSALQLAWKYIFGLGIWGEITTRHFLVRGIRKRLQKKGNRISKTGWPVNTVFEGVDVSFPIHSLGACLVRKDWLLISPFDEVLDRYGIGENYGVVLGFPEPGVQVVRQTCVYHHQEKTNRLNLPLQYYRRVMALDYFIRIKRTPGHVKRRWLFWSLFGPFIRNLISGNGPLIRAGWRSLIRVISARNPYYAASKKGIKVTEPVL